jgi:hypothetical protein
MDYELSRPLLAHAEALASNVNRATARFECRRAPPRLPAGSHRQAAGSAGRQDRRPLS